MNLRTLKKLCKRAAPLLRLLGDDRQQFTAAPWDNYHHIFIGDRKHWERSRCHETYEPRNGWLSKRGAERVYRTRSGRTMVMRPPVHPRKGTIMVGSTVGYYEPEWEEQCAWSALEDLVYAHFQDWDADREDVVLTRSFAGVGDIFSAAREIIAERKAA